MAAVLPAVDEGHQESLPREEVAAREGVDVVVAGAREDVVVAGGVVGFGITVTNTGAGVAYDATITDVLPSGVAWSIDSDGPRNTTIS